MSEVEPTQPSSTTAGRRQNSRMSFSSTDRSCEASSGDAIPGSLTFKAVGGKDVQHSTLASSLPARRPSEYLDTNEFMSSESDPEDDDATDQQDYTDAPLPKPDVLNASKSKLIIVKSTKTDVSKPATGQVWN